MGSRMYLSKKAVSVSRRRPPWHPRQSRDASSSWGKALHAPSSPHRTTLRESFQRFVATETEAGDTTSAIIQALPPVMQTELAVRLALDGDVPPDVLDYLALSLCCNTQCSAEEEQASQQAGIRLRPQNLPPRCDGGLKLAALTALTNALQSD